MKRVLRWHDHVTINIYWFALTTRSQVLASLIIPLLVQQFVGEEVKGAYVGNIRLGALMVALLVQALMGLLSDRSTLRWGRRRPFIVAGTLGQLVVLTLIGLTASLEGMTAYWVLFGLYVLSMVASDTAHAAAQGLIPDLVPEDKRGLTSGVKALLEAPVPMILVALVVGRMITAGNLWGALILVMAVLVVCMLVTLLVREEPLDKAPLEVDWTPFLRLLGMTAAFTLIILGTGAVVKAIMSWTLDLAPAISRALTGLVGLAGMAVPVILGVWIGLRIGIGPGIRASPSYAWWVISRLAFLVPGFSLGSFVIFFLQERFADLAGEKAAGPAATLVMFVGLFVLLAALPGGWLADRFSKKPLMAISGLMAAVATFVVVLVPNLTAINIGGCLIGTAAGLFYAANWALGTQLVPQEQAGRYLGLSNLAGAGAGAIGAYIGGPIADSLGYTMLFAIYGLFWLLSIVTLLGIQEKGLQEITV
jgi:MFS family permease